MTLQAKTAERLWIYLNNSSYHHDTPLFEAILCEARRLGIAGGTVTKGVLGFGSEKWIRGKSALVPANNIPMKVELIDSSEKLNLILPFLEKNLKNGLITREPVNILLPEPPKE